MITNKDIRVENGSLIINGDPYPLDGQSPEAIMQIVEDNSDSTPTAESSAPVTSAGIKTYVDTAIGNKIKIITPETVYYTCTSTNLEYTGVSVECPTGHEYIVRAKCNWDNANTQSIAVSDSSSDVSTQRRFAYSESAYVTFMLGAGETAYIWGKWASASRNAVMLTITDITL